MALERFFKKDEICSRPSFLPQYFSPPKSKFHASFIWDFRVLCNYVRRCGQNDPIALVFVCFLPLWVKVESASSSPGIETKGPGPKSWPLQSTVPLQNCQFSQFFCYFFVIFLSLLKKTNDSWRAVPINARSWSWPSSGHDKNYYRHVTVKWDIFMFSDDDAVTPKRSLQSQK